MKKNFEVVEFDEKADIYVINTCTVTNMADRKSRQMLRKVKEVAPEAVLVVVGCYAQVGKDELERIPEIDLILGNNEKKDVVKFAEEVLENKLDADNVQNIERRDKEEAKAAGLAETGDEKALEGQAEDKVVKQQQNKAKDERAKKPQGKAGETFAQVSDVLHCEEYSEFGDVTFTEKTRAVIKVQDGCDRFCSYCIIPFARGHIRSRRPEQVVSEITKITQAGIKEVVITGIHLASYGRDFGKTEMCKNLANDKKTQVPNNLVEQENRQVEYRLIDLLEAINEIEGIERIRLRFVGANAYNGRICKKVG